MLCPTLKVVLTLTAFNLARRGIGVHAADDDAMIC